MELHSFILSAIVLLTAAALSVTLFKHLGLGSILGLLVAGIAVGPHSPGPMSPPMSMTCATSPSWAWCCSCS
jgi:glutathione-regulated potassium-efflux system ancillary protein KefC